MKLFKTSSAFALAAVMAFTSACGSSSSTSTTDTGTISEQDAEAAVQTTLNQVVSMATTYGAAFSSSAPAAVKLAAIDLDVCTNEAGTASIDLGEEDETVLTVSYSDCEFEGSTLDGTFTLTVDEVAEELVMDYDTFTIVTDEETVSMDGVITMSFNAGDETFTIGYESFTIDTDSAPAVTVNAELTFDVNAGTIDGTITVTSGSVTLYTCTFNDFDPTTASSSEWDGACTE